MALTSYIGNAIGFTEIQHRGINHTLVTCKLYSVWFCLFVALFWGWGVSHCFGDLTLNCGQIIWYSQSDKKFEEKKKTLVTVSLSGASEVIKSQESVRTKIFILPSVDSSS